LAVSFNISLANGAVIGVGAAVACALVAMCINIARYLSPVPDLEF